MKKISIIFDKRSTEWTYSIDENTRVITWAINLVDTRRKVLGYIYLDRIYEILGIPWNPRWENACLACDDITRSINYRVKKHMLASGENVFEIIIENF